MNGKSDKPDPDTDIETIADIAEQAERGEDVSGYFTNQHVAKQRVNIDFPLGILRQIDEECQRVGVTRQAWIKMVCAEWLWQRQRQPQALVGLRAEPLDKERSAG